ncbi:hypothetical protein OQA88_881 [Cercophora sp. LCS_1]
MPVSTRALAIAFWAQQAASAYTATVCDQRSYTSSGNITYNPNAWNPDNHGFQCISVQDSPPAFAATWAWLEEPQTVHSYPHVKLAAPALPVALSNISALIITAQWSMGPGSRPLPALDVDSPGLENLGATANVAFDIFADRNPRAAKRATTAETEIMIWVGQIGPAQPLGTLYRGQNKRGTDVFTWVATTVETNFAGEISPLLQSLWRNGLVSIGSHIGLVEFGSEAFHSIDNVTFSASNFHLRILTGPAPMIEVGGLEGVCSIAASLRPPSGRKWWLSGLSIIGIVTAAICII